MRICEIEKCDKKHFALGFCKEHYCKNYSKSPKGKAVLKKYASSKKGKERNKRYVHSENAQAKIKDYRQSEKGNADRRKSEKKQQEKHPEKFKARYIAKKNVQRQQCEIYKCIKLGERHHEDYSKPMEVKFLCRDHHIELHKY